MQGITANLIVDRIEDCLPFWVDRLGFKAAAEVPHGDSIGFVILGHDDLELMLQSQASLAADVSEASTAQYRASLYIRVADLEPIRAGLADWPRAIPERTTFYGAREIIVSDPAGNLVAFAAPNA